MKFNNHDMSHGGGIIHADYGKKMRRFHTICHIWCLLTEASEKNIRALEEFDKIWTRSDYRIVAW
jgi:hypothetical protein